MQRQTITEIAAALRDGSVTSRQLTEAALARIDAGDGVLNSFITVTKDAALSAADAADAVLAKGNGGPLTGVPIAHKDIFCTRDILTTCGSKMLGNFISPYDATVVKNLAAAGVVVVGKTNMDEFAMGSSTETSFFGPTANPWDTTRSPGGSSGGSAAAVAAGFVPAATGTDTGGSIRQPAALTGITGFKPTYGRVSRYGMIAFASSLDQAGVLTLTAQDAALLMQVMAGFDPQDSTSADRPVPDYPASLGDSLQGKRIGMPTEFFDDGLEAESAACIRAAITVLEGLGATIKEVSLPNIGASVPTYYMLTRKEGFGAEVKRRIMTGTYVLSAGYYDAYYLQAQKARQLIADDFRRCFESVDIIAGPTTPTPAFKLGEKVDDPVQMYLNDIYTIGVNLAGLPGVSVPCGFSAGLPVGLQLIGPAFGEGVVLNFAHQFQQQTDWHLKAPDYPAGK